MSHTVLIGLSPPQSPRQISRIRSVERRLGKERRSWRDWSSDVCSSYLENIRLRTLRVHLDPHEPYGSDWLEPTSISPPNQPHQIGRASSRERAQILA